MKIYTKSQISEIEYQSSQFGVSTTELMENAGKAAFDAVCRYAGTDLSSVVILCGAGNNGGDGLVIARLFALMGVNVTVVLVFGNVKTSDSKIMLEKLPDVNVINYITNSSEVFDAINIADVVVDAIFGTGFHGEIDDNVALLTTFVSKYREKTVSLDLPSGVECDSGKAAKASVKAALTIAFIAKKPCHIFYPSSEYCGKVEVVDIGIPSDAYLPCNTFIVSGDEVKETIGKPRPNVCHKYDFGRALLICGSYGMAGAAKLATSAAIKCGAGLVTVCLPKLVYIPVASGISEAVFYPCEESSEGKLSISENEKIQNIVQKSSAVLVGCGMGCNDDTKAIVNDVVINSKCPVVIDADGINCIALNINIIRAKQSPMVITPHMGEMSRLCGLSANEIENNILTIGRKFSVDNNVVLVLKGPRTVIFAPNGNAYINTTGNSGMATAGCGDMLAGMIVSLLAQGVEPLSAAIAAVYIHGKSGDKAKELHSKRAMTPTDMINCLDGIFCEYEK